MGAEALAAWHADRLLALAGADPPGDVFAFETVPCVTEVAALVSLLSRDDVAAAIGAREAWISVSCGAPSLLCSGEPVGDAYAAAVAGMPTVAAFGINCTAPDLVSSLLDALPPPGDRPLPVIVYCNSGEIWDADGRGWLPAAKGGEHAASASAPHAWCCDPEPLATWINPEAGGVRGVGGCCRVRPLDIRCLADRLKAKPGGSAGQD